MSKAGTINVLTLIECAFCGDIEKIPVPLGFNMPSLSYSIEHSQLMRALAEADLVKTDIGWMHKSCAALYHRTKAKENSPKPIEWPASNVQPEGSML